ncbi:MAG: hypothetical protein GY797_18520 [Deltaproteobacteria bacterium]|nr:hypothetical protein [Deltaproteobacteria bacterium]
MNKARTNPGVTPLWIASQNCYSEVVRLLLEANADVNKTHVNGASPLHIASQNGHIEVVKLLLAANVDVNKANKDGFTSLFMASQNCHPEVVRLLLEANARMEKANKDGATPLYAASQNGHTEVVKLLLAAKNAIFIGNGISAQEQSPNSTSTIKLKVLSESMDADDITEILKLLKSGADVNLINENGYSPLYMASMDGHAEIVKLLLEAGADVNKASTNGITPLYSASVAGTIKVVRLLLEAGADVNKSGADNCTPLCGASSLDNTEVVKLLKKYGAKFKVKVSYEYESGGLSKIMQQIRNPAQAGHKDKEDKKTNQKNYEKKVKAKAVSPKNNTGISSTKKLATYVVGSTTEESFLADGWNSTDPDHGILGIVKLHRTGGLSVYSLGLRKLRSSSSSMMSMFREQALNHVQDKDNVNFQTDAEVKFILKFLDGILISKE